MRTLTGKRFWDIGLFVLGFAILIHVSHEFRVYYRDARTQVALVAVTSDGARLDLETPSLFRGRQEGLFATLRRIRGFVQTEEGRELTPVNGQLEWSIRYRTRHASGDAVWTLSTPEAEDAVDD